MSGTLHGQWGWVSTGRPMIQLSTTLNLSCLKGYECVGMASCVQVGWMEEAGWQGCSYLSGCPCLGSSWYTQGSTTMYRLAAAERPGEQR
jgi:hypothetical protein